MFATLRLTEGLLVAHIFLAGGFLVGSTAFPWEKPRNTLNDNTLLYVVCCTAAGTALLGFVLFALGIFHLMTPVGIGIAYAATFIAVAARHKGAPLHRAFWAERVSILARSIDAGALAVYFVVLALSAHAIIRDYGGSDPVAYHLAYAADWAHAARLSVDPFLRTPFYASNFVLFFTVLLAFGGGLFVNFLTWATSLLTAMVIFASSREVLRDRIPQPLATLASFLLTIAVLIAPVFYRWNDTAYIDVAIGTFPAIATVALWKAVREKTASWLWMACLCAAFFVGIKASFIAFIPVFVIAIYAASRALNLSGPRTAALVLSFLALSSPWYLRNIVLAGDPTPPIFNIALHGYDAFVTRGEMKTYTSDLHTARTATDFVTLPWRAFKTPLSHDFREYGSTALILLLFFPAIVVFASFVRKGRISLDVGIVCATFTVFVLYWFATSSLLRYGLVLYALLPIAVSVALAASLPASMSVRNARIAGIAVALCAALAIIPSPGSAQFFRERYNADYRFLFSSYTDDDAYLMKFSPGYAETRDVISKLRNAHMSGRVYVIADSVNYYFRSERIVSIGDWSGPAGFFKMFHALEARQLDRYLRDLNVSAVVIDPGKVPGGLYEPLREQLSAAGYCEAAPAHSRWTAYYADKRACAQ